MKQKSKKKATTVLRKKLAEIDSGKWKASPDDIGKLKKSLQDAEFAEKEAHIIR